MRSRFVPLLALTVGLVVLSTRPAAAVTADPAYVVGSIAIPAVNAADVAAAGSAIFVGQGPFGAGLQSIVRLDRDGTATTLVTGLNALGGIVYDQEGDRLLFTDNGGEQIGATSGDTVYALPSPLTAAVSVSAATLTLLPSGSIPSAQAVLALAGGDVLIGDAVGPGSGRVVQLSGVTPTDLITGIDYTSGVSLTLAGNEILVGNVDGSFVGSVQRYSLAGAFLGTLIGGLNGSYDQVLDGAGNLLLTGGFTDDFSSSTVVSIAPGGASTEIASGFGFSSGVGLDGPSGQVYVLDFGLSSIDTLTPVAGFTPGGFGSKDCQLEAWGGAPERSGSGRPKTRWTCTDGDPACDRDVAENGACEFLVGGCFSVTDPRTPKCTAAPVTTATATSKQLPTAAADVEAALAEVLPSTGAVCSRGVPVTVPADKKTRPIALDTQNGLGKRIDKDVLKLRCLPAV